MQWQQQQQQHLQQQQQQQQHSHPQHQILHQHQPNLHYPQQQLVSPDHLQQRTPLSTPLNMMQQDPRYYMSPGYAGAVLPSDGAPHHQPAGQMGMYPQHALNVNVQGASLSDVFQVSLSS
jgi:hypothetical protein